MKYFEKKLGERGGYVKYYIQEPHVEIDPNRKFPTLVICPGGAYLWTSFREDESVALRFLAEGFNVAVVHYATEGREAYQVETVDDLPASPATVFPNPLVELATAVAEIRNHKEEWAVDEDYIIVGGFSAGGNLAAQLGTLWHEDWLSNLVGENKETYRPTHLLLAYAALDFTPRKLPSHGEINTILHATTGELELNQEKIDRMNPIKHVSKYTPPSFIWHTLEDVLVPATDALSFSQALSKVEVPYELHIFNKGKHGLVLGDLRTGIKLDQANAQVYK
uniref:alpha/beta hydrolase n=1 Tax=Streptococcus merionis TaxID=400065 RepID=UPI0026EE9355